MPLILIVEQSSMMIKWLLTLSPKPRPSKIVEFNRGGRLSETRVVASYFSHTIAPAPPLIVGYCQMGPRAPTCDQAPLFLKAGLAWVTAALTSADMSVCPSLCLSVRPPSVCTICTGFVYRQREGTQPSYQKVIIWYKGEQELGDSRLSVVYAALLFSLLIGQ